MDWTMLTPVLPEIFLSVWAMVLLLVGVYLPSKQAFTQVQVLTGVGLVVALMLVIDQFLLQLPMWGFPRLADGSGPMVVMDGFAVYTKVFILLGALGAVALAGPFLQHKNIAKPEYGVLILLSVVGMGLLTSAYDLLTLYIGLEMMSFSLYILAAFERDNPKASEAALKYFVLGALSSGLLLYGMSLFYGIAGATDFGSIQQALASLAAPGANLTVAVALVLILVGLVFKVSAVPFHMWTPDVYEGAPTPVTAFMAVVPKLAAFAILIRVLYAPLIDLLPDWQMILALLAVLTMAGGAFLAIVQTNLKRLLAYSSIAHVGFVLVGLATGTVEGVAGALFYLVVYGVMTLGTFGCLLLLHHRGMYLEDIKDLAGLGKQAPLLSVALLIFLFSLAGVPPLAGFFAKFYVFQAAVAADLTWLAIVGVGCSVVAAVYSLKLIKILFFEDGKPLIDPVMPRLLRAMVTLMALITVGLGILPNTLAVAAQQAAQSLF